MRSLKLQSEALYEWGVRALARRSLTEAELRRRLSTRAATKESVDRALSRLRRAGYLDDERTAESHAVHRREIEAVAGQRAFVELRRRGVSAEIARQAVGDVYSDVDELELIDRRLERSGDLGRLEGDPKAALRLIRGLARAGFRSDKIVEALRRRRFAAEWLDEAAEAESEAQLPSDSDIG